LRFKIKYIDFRNNIVIFISDYYIGFKHVHSLDELTINIKLDAKIEIPNRIDEQEIISAAWNQEEDKWLISLAGNDNGDNVSRIYSIYAYSPDDIKITANDIIVNEQIKYLNDEKFSNIIKYRTVSDGFVRRNSNHKQRTGNSGS